MGCGSSKLEEQEAVTHCKERSILLAEAIQYRYALADSHVAYMRALQSIGPALSAFLNPKPVSASPLLTLPPQRKGDMRSPVPIASAVPVPVSVQPVENRASNSDGSHIHFRSDEEESDTGSHIHFHSDEEEEDLPDRQPVSNQPTRYTMDYTGNPQNGFMGPQPTSQYPMNYPTNPQNGFMNPQPFPNPTTRYTTDYTSNPQDSFMNPQPVNPSTSYGMDYTANPQNGYMPPQPVDPSTRYGMDYPANPQNGYMPPQPVNPSTRYTMNYAKSQPPNPSVSYAQRVPDNPQTVYPSFYNLDPYPPQSSSLYPPYPPYSSNEPTNGGYYGNEPTNGGYFGNFGPPAQQRGEEMPLPPAPPSPPQVSTWDFLNPFETYDSYYSAPYTPSRSSKEVRDEEGIPDLEEEQEVVKAAYGDEKSKGLREEKGKGLKGEQTGREKGNGSQTGREKGSGSETGREKEVESVSSGDESGLEQERERVVDKNMVRETERSVGTGNLAVPVPVGKSYGNDLEVVREVNLQFERVYESANQVSALLEVGKQPYQQKDSPLKDSLRMMCGLPSTSGSDEDLLNFEEDKAISSTLQKLYVWEKKLLQEVKTEEKLRVTYDMKRQELRYLDERGAEPHKIEATEKRIRKLSTQISVAMQVVSTISNKISVLRDEELWPQICDIIQGLTKMWGAMSESHAIQHHAISFAKNLDSILTAPNLSSTHLDATKDFEIRLLDWTSSFSSWISMQKSYVKTLNAWLVKGLNYVEEITEDGPVPFSPGRLGAPPVFVVLNQWANNLDLVSEREVLVAMRELGFRVLGVWEKYRVEQRQSLMANEGMDKALRVMEREEQEMRRKVGELEREREEREGGSVQEGLKRVFEEMGRFSEGLVRVYEDLKARAEEEKERGKEGSEE